MSRDVKIITSDGDARQKLKNNSNSNLRGRNRLFLSENRLTFVD